MKYKILYTNLEGGDLHSQRKNQLLLYNYIIDKDSDKESIFKRLIKNSRKKSNQEKYQKYLDNYNDLKGKYEHENQIDFYTKPNSIVGNTILIKFNKFEILGVISNYKGSSENIFENSDVGITNVYEIKDMIFGKKLANMYLPKYKFVIKNSEGEIKGHKINLQKTNKEIALNSLIIKKLTKIGTNFKYYKNDIEFLSLNLINLVKSNEFKIEHFDIIKFVKSLIQYINNSFFEIYINKFIFTNLYVVLLEVNKKFENKFNIDFIDANNDLKLQKFIFTKLDLGIFTSMDYFDKPPIDLSKQNNENRLKLGQFVQFYFNNEKVEGIITFALKDNDIYKISLLNGKTYDFDSTKYDTIFNVLNDKSIKTLDNINLDKTFTWSLNKSLCKKIKFIGKFLKFTNKNDNNNQKIGVLVKISETTGINECNLTFYELTKDGFNLNDSFDYKFSDYKVKYSDYIYIQNN